MPLTEFDLKAMPTPQNGCGEGKGGKLRRVDDYLAVGVEGRTYQLARDVVKDAPVKMGWDRVNVLQ